MVRNREGAGNDGEREADGDAEEEEARVNARLHQLVLLALRRFNVMTEVALHLNLRACAQQPAAETEREAYPQRVHIHP